MKWSEEGQKSLYCLLSEFVLKRGNMDFSPFLRIILERKKKVEGADKKIIIENLSSEQDN